MRKALLVVMICVVAGLAFTQEVYTERALAALGLEPEEIEKVISVVDESENQLRRLHADLDIKKAELARLLLEDEPNMRLVERNLNETAAIEVQIRMTEIRRQLEVRGIVGTTRWARVLQAIRVQRAQQDRQEALEAARQEAAEQLGELQRSIAERQEDLARILQERRDLLDDPEVREQFENLQRQFHELQEIIRERL